MERVGYYGKDLLEDTHVVLLIELIGDPRVEVDLVKNGLKHVEPDVEDVWKVVFDGP